MKELTLFYKPTCPYCQKVMNFMEQEGISVDKANIQDSENRQRLIEVGKMDQVPCLFIDGDPMYESDDIIAYLRQCFCKGV